MNRRQLGTLRNALDKKVIFYTKGAQIRTSDSHNMFALQPPLPQKCGPQKCGPPGKNLRSFLSNFYCDCMMFYALILSSKGKTGHSKNITLAKNAHSDANSV